MDTPMLTQTQRDILHVVPGLFEGPGVTVREISDMLGVARTYVYKVIRNLVNRGFLVETGYYGDQIRKYTLTSSGEALYLLHVR